MLKKVNTLLILIFLLSLGIRLASYPGIFLPDGIHFNGADSYYHARRIEYGIKHFPKVLISDQYMAFPKGGYCIWPPLFDFLIATVSWIISLGKFNRTIMEITAVLFPPIIGAFTVFPLFGLGRLLFSKGAGLAAASLLAILPVHIAYSKIGRVDQHVLEVLLFTCFLYFFLKTLSWASEIKASSEIGPDRKAFLPMIYSGIMLASLILTWQGAIVFPLLMAIYFLMQLFIDKLKNRSQKPLFYVIAVPLTTCLMILFPITWLALHLEPQVPFSYVAFSYFQPVFVLAVLIVSILIGMLFSERLWLKLLGGLGFIVLLWGLYKLEIGRASCRERV